MISKFPNGVSSFGVPVMPGGIPFVTSGSVFFVHHSGSNGNSGLDPSQPLATIDYAIGKCTASKGDVILVMPGHTETVTSSITMDVAGVTIWGMGWGNLRPLITHGLAGDAITITAANCMVGNLRFMIGIDAVTAFVNVAAAGCVVKDLRIQSATTGLNSVGVITVTADGDDCLIDGVQIYNEVVESVGGIVIEGAATNVEVCNCMVFDSIGFTNGCINDAATATGLWIHHNLFSNVKSNTVVAEFGNNSTGAFCYNAINGRHGTIGSNITASNAMGYFENYVSGVAGASGIIQPAVDS